MDNNILDEIKNLPAIAINRKGKIINGKLRIEAMILLHPQYSPGSYEMIRESLHRHLVESWRTEIIDTLDTLPLLSETSIYHGGTEEGEREYWNFGVEAIWYFRPYFNELKDCNEFGKYMVQRGIITKEENDSEHSCWYGHFKSLERAEEVRQAINALIVGRFESPEKEK